MLSFILSEKSLLIVLTLIGMAMCTAGIGQVAARGEWLHPLSMIAYVLGALVLLVTVAGVFGINLPLIDSTRAALVAVIVLAVLKVAVTQLHRSIA